MPEQTFETISQPTITTSKYKGAHIIVLGNEKGGSGKTTTAMHLITLLLYEGAKVGSIDLDIRQRSLTRYVENRRLWTASNGIALRMPQHCVLEKINNAETFREAEKREKEMFEETLCELSAQNDFIVIDSPGTDTYLSRLAHASADTLITPLNDSFVDIDLLGRVDPQSYRVKGLSFYSEMVWESRKQKALHQGTKMDWVVMRNRLSHLDARNKRRVEGVLQSLAEKVGFRIAPGFSERVIFRELFPSGLTLLDLREDGIQMNLSLSHVVARAEVRSLLETLALPIFSKN